MFPKKPSATEVAGIIAAVGVASAGVLYLYKRYWKKANGDLVPPGAAMQVIEKNKAKNIKAENTGDIAEQQARENSADGDLTFINTARPSR